MLNFIVTKDNATAILKRHPLSLRKMRLSEVKERFPLNRKMVEISSKYDVPISRVKYLGMNSGGAGPNGIELGPFDNKDKEWLVFFHELGHIESARFMRHAGVEEFLNTISCEAMAWEFGFRIAKREGYNNLLTDDYRQRAKELFNTYNDEDSWNNGENISRLLG